MLPDKSDLNSYGGPLTDYAPVTDPTTDEPVKVRNIAYQDVGCMTHTSAVAIVSFVGATAANPTNPSSGFVQDSQWSGSAAAPTLARSGTGQVDITLPTSVQIQPLFARPAADGGGVTTFVNLRRAYAQVECSDGTLRHAVARVTGANTVRVNTYLANGTADDLNGFTVTVWIY